MVQRKRESLSDYSFPFIKRLIKAAYSEVGKPSPFDAEYKRSMYPELNNVLPDKTDGACVANLSIEVLGIG